MVLATNDPWWFTASGVLPGPKLAKAASGTIVSLLVLTAAAEDALPLPVLASALVAALRAELAAIVAAVVAVPVVPAVATVPTTALVVSAPERVPPDGADIDVLQRLRALPVARRDLHDHVVLVLGAVDGGDLALAECVIQGVVDLAGG